MIADFDYDKTIDFEEFCGMMLTFRAARTPAWLTDRFADGVATADLTRAGTQKLLPLDTSSPSSTRDRNTSCATLRLRGHGIGPFVASELAEVLTHVNATLRTVDLSRNLIADEGARAFAAALKRNRVLTALDLSANGISEAGGTEILMARRGKHGVVSCALGEVAAGVDARRRRRRLPLRRAARPPQEGGTHRAGASSSRSCAAHGRSSRPRARRRRRDFGAAVASSPSRRSPPHGAPRGEALTVPAARRLPRPLLLLVGRLSHTRCVATALVLALLVAPARLASAGSAPAAAPVAAATGGGGEAVWRSAPFVASV